MDKDTYRTIASPAEGIFKDKGSKFLAYAYPVSDEAEIKENLDVLRKKYYDATHHCYAWRLGSDGDKSRANDDGEPSGTAGKPILGQLLSADLTNMLVVVVRYFGGTKLGVSGLINAYRESARGVIDNSEIIEKTVDALFNVIFPYQAMNGVMKVVKELDAGIGSQKFDNVCEMELSVRKSMEHRLADALEKCEGAQAVFAGYR